MDIHSLERFVQAQARMYAFAYKEIVNGKKRSHWMWFIFPQLRGLGRSTMAYTYGIAGREEALAYLAHPILSARLTEITEALLALHGKTAVEIFGDIDTVKLRSSMTLFAYLSENGSIFHRVLETYFQGENDPKTLALLEKGH